MSKPRVILDTNTLVSAVLIRGSVPDQVLKAARRKSILLFSETTFSELSAVLQRPKFDRYVPKEERLKLLVILQQKSVKVQVKAQIQDCRDPKDNKFLELAVDGQADYLITGDQDLLVLHPFRKIKIITPAQFLDENLN
ncbi:putative toxin-antitoxin system toxin component, PIN family [[Limnothrix rosea] IAM M-220]|uniref:putative toxin-antitoxin system toxin component, PIN family n=1 Tax=[Limnothrix rosea] IAM M-220 TaxID=454133 RepID=UPI00095BE4D6|nr:putative toxin-antitoxin system toxin component, PIN family [[Limnothrix rosea] IAM M-220]OKH10930.1 putative toxin-antitoxin system toxin component, PIN family [[Limnothrix rosea] IAM M-220]